MIRRNLGVLGAFVLVCMLATVPAWAAGRPNLDVTTTFSGEAVVQYWCIEPNPYTPYGWYAERIYFSGETGEIRGLGSLSVDGWSTAYPAYGAWSGEVLLSGRGGTMTLLNQQLMVPTDPWVTIGAYPLGLDGTTGMFTRVSPGTLPIPEPLWGSYFLLRWDHPQQLIEQHVNCFDDDQDSIDEYGPFDSTPPDGGPFTVVGTFEMHLEYQ